MSLKWASLSIFVVYAHVESQHVFVVCISIREAAMI